MKTVIFILGVVMGFVSRLSAEGITSNEDTIYDSDPNHLWNRLFVMFYRQKIANNTYDRFDTGWSMNRVGEARWVGPDVLDPPLGYHPRFLLEDEPFAKCNALLVAILTRHRARLIDDPLKRALLQRDLWAVFDVLTQAGQRPIFPFPTSSEFINPSPLPAAQEQHRVILEAWLAQVIRSLALSRKEIERLPDTYSAAINSGAFSDVLETNRYDYLPHDLFAANSGWQEILPGHSFAQQPPQVLELLEHTLVAGGRSVFRAFVKLPADSQDKNILAKYAVENVRFSEETDRHFEAWRQFWFTNKITRSNVVELMRHPEAWQAFSLTNRESVENLDPKPARDRPRRLPWGTQFLLLREMICLDEKGQMVPTHVVESVQFHTSSYRDRSGVERALGREFEMSRALLFRGQQGGLRPISAGEPRVRYYNNLGHLRVDEEGNGPAQKSFPQNCIQCHLSNGLLSPVVAFSTPARSVSIEPIVRWKQERGKLDQLRKLILSPASDR